VINGIRLQEVHAICEHLVERLTKSSEKLLLRMNQEPVYFEMSPVELYAITERLKMAEPTTCMFFRAEVVRF
jgi:hypothetical protein